MRKTKDKSKTPAWTPEQQEQARVEGWELIDTVENGKSTPRLRIYACKGASNQKANSYVMGRAREGSALHIRALRVIAQGLV